MSTKDVGYGMLLGGLVGYPAAELWLSVVIRGGGGADFLLSSLFVGAGMLTGGIVGVVHDMTAGAREVFEFPKPLASIRSILIDSISFGIEDDPKHVVVTLGDNQAVFGSLLRDSLVVQLRTRPDRLLEFPRGLVRSIEAVSTDNYEDSGLRDLWILTRDDGSAVLAETLEGIINDTLRCIGPWSRFTAACAGLRTVVRVNDRSVWERGTITGYIVGGGMGVIGVAAHGLVGLLAGVTSWVIATPVAGTLSRMMSPDHTRLDLSRIPHGKRVAMISQLIVHKDCNAAFGPQTRRLRDP